MRIIIVSDTHLGRKNFKVDEREKDFENAFRQVIDYSVNNSADAVIHCGDLFDSGRPSVSTLLFTISELKRLKDAKIPLFIIAGSHDISVDESFLKILDSLGLLMHVSDKKNYCIDGGNITIKGAEHKGLFVCGLYAKDTNINETLSMLKPDCKNGCFKVFVFHHIVSDISTLFNTVKKSSLPKGFDLYVSGHWHEKFEADIDNKKLLYPGSTENCDFREIISGARKGFYDYDTETNKYSFVELKTRESEVVTIECGGLTADEVKAELIKKIGKGDGKMLFFMLKGRLKRGVKSSINKQEVYDKANSNGYLFCKIYAGELENPEDIQVESSKKTIAEIEKEFFKNKGLNEEEIRIAEVLLEKLGNDYSSSELERRTSEAIKILEGGTP